MGDSHERYCGARPWTASKKISCSLRVVGPGVPSPTTRPSTSLIGVISTAVEITPIKEVDGRVVGDGTPGPTTRKLQEIFFDAVHGRAPQYRSWLSPIGAD